MNKKAFNTVLVFTGSVLLGIILLQVLWLSNLVQARRQELASNTQQALSGTVDKLERNENISMITEDILGEVPDGSIPENHENVIHIKGPLPELEKQVQEVNDSLQTTAQLMVKINNSLAYTNGQMDSLQNPQDHVQYIQTGNQILINTQKIVGTNIKTVDSLVHTTTNILENIPHVPYIPAKEQVIIDSVTIARASAKANQVNGLVHQMIFELKARSANEQINADTLREVLTQELANRGILIPFEFAVLEGDSIVNHSAGYIPPATNTGFRIKLFPGDIFDRDLKLIMYYPPTAASGYVFSKMQTFLWLTGLFTLGILVAFYITIRTISKQKKLGEMKNDFINNITHEFKTPIATSLIAIAALENKQVKNDPGMLDYYTGVLKEENLKMNQQVEKVLQMAMMEKGKVEIFFEEVDVHAMVRQSVKGFELIFQENQVQVDLQLQAEKHLVKTDPFHLLHVFNNIIDNAVKYKNDPCRLVIATEIKNNFLLVHFTDNGPGMSAQVLKNAFDKFYRGQQGDVHDVKGFGLGLSYVKNIVALSQGTVDLQSSPGKGTEVVISLPLA